MNIAWPHRLRSRLRSFEGIVTAVAAAVSVLFIVVLLTSPRPDGANPVSFAMETTLCVAAGFSGRWPIQAGVATMILQASLLLFPHLDSTFACLTALLPIASLSALGRWRAGALFSLIFLTLSSIGETQGSPAPTTTQVAYGVREWLFVVAMVWLTTFGFHQLQRALQREYAAQVDKQRRIIARQLHDTAAQSLGRISLISGSAEDTDLAPESRKTLQEVGELARSAADDLDAMLVALRDEDIDLASVFHEHITLDEALTQAADSLRRHGFSPVILNGLGNFTVAPAVQDCLIAGVRESAQNIAKHGEPETCTLRLSIASDFRTVALTATNRTSGLHNRPTVGGHGLVGVRERATILNGKFTSTRSPVDHNLWLTSLTLPLRGDLHE